jgi:hypothetical protein
MSDEIVQRVKMQLLPLNLESLMVQNDVKTFTFTVNSWGGGDRDSGLNGRYQDGRHISSWGRDTPEWFEAFWGRPEVQQILTEIEGWADSIEDYWDSEDGGEVSLMFSIDENGNLIKTLELQVREEESRNGHSESETEIDLKSEQDYSSWQQVFAYFRKEKRKNPECKLDFMVEFWGGGDSGSIEDIQAGCDILRKLVTLPDGRNESVQSVLESFAYRFIDASGVDWYNNDGGFGSMSIRLEEEPEPKAIFDLDVNYYEKVLKPHTKINLN